MALAVAGVAALARLRDEERAEPLGLGEAARELRVAARERGALRGGEAIDRTLEHLVLAGRTRKQGLAASRRAEPEKESGEEAAWVDTLGMAAVQLPSAGCARARLPRRRSAGLVTDPR